MLPWPDLLSVASRRLRQIPPAPVAVSYGGSSFGGYPGFGRGLSRICLASRCAGGLGQTPFGSMVVLRPSP